MQGGDTKKSHDASNSSTSSTGSTSSTTDSSAPIPRLEISVSLPSPPPAITTTHEPALLSQSHPGLPISRSPSGQSLPNRARSPLQKQKGPQKVRFPLDNNPETKKVYLPSDESSIGPHSDTYLHSNAGPSTPGETTPTGGSYFTIKAAQSNWGYRLPQDEEDLEMWEQEEQNSTFDARPPISRGSSFQALLPARRDHTDDSDQENMDSGDITAAGPGLHSNQRISVGQFMGPELFDVGLITSGGLAPGAGLGDKDARAAPHQRDHRPGNADLEANETTINTRYNSGSGPGSRGGGVGPYGDFIEDHGTDIPLLELHRHELNRRLHEIELDRKLNELAEAAGGWDAATQNAANVLVRQHSRYLKSRQTSPIAADMTVPSSDYFNNTGGSDSPHNLAGSEPNGDLAPGEEKENNSNAMIQQHRDNEQVEGEVRQDGTVTPMHEDYVAAPSHVRQGVLGSLLKLYGQQQQSNDSASAVASTDVSAVASPSGASTPSGIETPSKNKSFSDLSSLKTRAINKFHKSRSASASMSSLSGLVKSSNAMLNIPGAEYDNSPGKTKKGTPTGPSRPKMPKRPSALEVLRAKKDKKRKLTAEREAAIANHIADVLQRERFILRLCRALMLFGAPTHRLEEYMKMTSRVLGIDGQFLYIPGCMICSFGDSSTHTSEMQLVRCVQGVNLHKLHETHSIYKEVIHGQINVEEAAKKLEVLVQGKNLYSPWLCVFFFALASMSVGPFAFGGRWHDMPISFALGGCVGILQIVVAPRSALYTNVFEVSASIVVSFLGRAFGSIGRDQNIFCFAAIVQSSLALILPGYIILCGSLELQSRNIVAGSVRMFYAIIYSLFLGFGITLGAAVYGWIDPNATSQTTCPYPMDPQWRILFIPCFTLTIALVNQAHWRQLPVMIFISACGYVVTFFSTRRFASAAELTSAIGALVIGVLGNMYSRVGHGLAFAAMLPAIFVQVPSGIASQGSLVAGIASANNIVSNTTTTPQDPQSGSASPGAVATLGFTMVQVSIGITVGLFAATLVVYPFGKKRSGLFTF